MECSVHVYDVISKDTHGHKLKQSSCKKIMILVKYIATIHFMNRVKFAMDASVLPAAGIDLQCCGSNHHGTPCYISLYWLVKRDSPILAYYKLQLTGSYHPVKTQPTNLFLIAQIDPCFASAHLRPASISLDLHKGNSQKVHCQQDIVHPQRLVQGDPKKNGL